MASLLVNDLLARPLTKSLSLGLPAIYSPLLHPIYLIVLTIRNNKSTGYIIRPSIHPQLNGKYKSTGYLFIHPSFLPIDKGKIKSLPVIQNLIGIHPPLSSYLKHKFLNGGLLKLFSTNLGHGPG